MSRRDRFVDLGIEPSEWSSLKEENQLAHLRSELSEGKGILLLYPISPKSVPMGAAEHVGSRCPLDPPAGVESVIGVGVIFPEPVGLEDDEDEVAYIGLPIHLFSMDDYDDEEIALLKTDEEGSADVDGVDYLQKIGEGGIGNL
jgi:hypothetical protein